MACGPAADHTAEPSGEKHHAEEPPREVHWGYSGDASPEHWADLSSEYALCGDGVEQSPIDLIGAVPAAETGIERRIGREVLTVEQRTRVMDLVDNGHTIQITNDVPMALDMEGVHYELVQFHFHAPSEHTINGVNSAMEAHCVHKDAAGKLLVVGFLVTVCVIRERPLG